jgi:signal transduction histidine kinase
MNPQKEIILQKTYTTWMNYSSSNMKFLYLIFHFILLPYFCWAQATTEIIQIDSLTEKGFLLDKGWKFQAGDNPRYADIDYDDSKWQSINPTLDVYDLPQLKQGIVWLRLHVRVVNPSDVHLALAITQSGASEVYLNGKLIRQFGVLSDNPAEIKAYNPFNKPISFPISDAQEQVMAIRYALQPDVRFSANWEYVNQAMKITVDVAENANNSYQQSLARNSEVNGLKIGLFGIFGVLYLFFYLFNPTHRVNLYFSVYAFSQAITWAILLSFNEPHFLSNLHLIFNLVLVLMVAGYLFMLQAIYVLMDQKRKWPFYVLVFLGLISIPIGAFVYGWGWLLFGIVFTSLVSIEITRVAFMAVANRKKGAWILAAGGIGYLVLWSHFILSNFFFVNTIINSIPSFELAWISIPIAVSIYLGYDFAQTLRSLKEKLHEVESLSQEKHEILAAQKEVLELQVEKRTAELQHSLEELKTTQTQLIHSEKLASLGQLTAGIAHEIKNPLNFVNNFSEVSMEMIEEIKEERAKSQETRDETLVDEILEDIQSNLGKIHEHGSRANGIVTSMLQHSRGGSGKKEPTDLNSLIKEYVNLSFHGMRAGKNPIDVDIELDLDPDLGMVSLIQEDFTRVIINLCNNAFDAMREKVKKPEVGSRKSEDGSGLGERYLPKLKVITMLENGRVQIAFEDNGPGIPEDIKDKILQPFFTTKKGTEGTGLGLSITHDIVKAHGGKLIINSQRDLGTSFTIELQIH